MSSQLWKGGFGATDCIKNDWGSKRQLLTTEWAQIES